MIKRWLERFQCRHVLVSAFALLLFASVAITARLLLDAGARSTERILEEVASRIRDQVRSEVSQFLGTPDLINEYTADAIRSGRVAVDDRAALLRLFRDAPRAEITYASSIYLGSATGDFAALDAKPPRWPPRTWRYVVSSRATGGVLDYLETDGTKSPVDDRSKTLPAFDPVDRPWYVAAVASDAPIWTRVYRNFDDDRLTLTRAVALHARDGSLLGVAGVDLFLEHLQDFLHRLDLGSSGEVFIVRPDGKLLGAHSGTGHDAELPARELIDVRESGQRFTRAAGERFAGIDGGIDENDFGGANGVQAWIDLDGERGRFSLTPVGRSQGLDWWLGVFVPTSDHVPSTTSVSRHLLPVVLITLGIALATFACFVELVVKPLRQLGSGAARIAVGEFEVPIRAKSCNEVGDLARAIDTMRLRLRDSFDELTEEKLRAETTLAAIADGVVTLTDAGRVRYMNPAAERLTGVPLHAARGRSVQNVFRARDERTGAPLSRRLILRSMADSHMIGQSVVLSSTDGTIHVVHCRMSPIVDEAGTVLGAVLNFSDLTEESRLKSELVHQATRDSLTDLVNRREFERRLGRAVDSARRRSSEHALCYIDLDLFKIVNDSEGHEAGDELLRQVARMLVDEVRAGDTVGRIGGDEFGVLLENCTLEQASRVVEKLRERIKDFRFLWNGRGHGIGISAGIVAIDERSQSPVGVMRDADSACYLAKEGGRNRVHVHRDGDAQMAHLRGERSWIERIERAFEENRFSLRAQRIEATVASAVPCRHVELLIRMTDESGRTLPPGEFLPAAERYHLGARIDRWVVAHALDWLASLPLDDSLPDLCSINLSGQSLGDETFLPYIVGEIHRTGVAPQRLCFEVTETATIAKLSSALRLIETLRELGCTFALDDFGSGLSSFGYLKTLTVDYLKIDGVFVRDMLRDPLDLAMVRSINEVGQTMGMRTIAEYVENDAIREALRAIGVDFVQGYAIGRPEPLDALELEPARLPMTADGDLE